jgi:hypothetical protein
MVWAILKLPLLTPSREHLPAFTRLCLGLVPGLLLGLAIAATAYCLRIWIPKTDPGHSWLAFLATAAAVLGLVMLPTIIAIYLPLVGALNSLAHN